MGESLMIITITNRTSKDKDENCRHAGQLFLKYSKNQHSILTIKTFSDELRAMVDTHQKSSE